MICGLALGLIEEAVEFAAGRIEGALLFFRAVVDQWAASQRIQPKNPAHPALIRDVMGHADVRDPDLHLIELATPGKWSVYERADKCRPRPQRCLWVTRS